MARVAGAARAVRTARRNSISPTIISCRFRSSAARCRRPNLQHRRGGGLDRAQGRRSDLHHRRQRIHAHPRGGRPESGVPMIDASLAFSIRQRWLVMIVCPRHGGLRRLEFHAAADRCGARHHQRAGADQQPVRPATRRWKSSSASRFRSRPRWADCRTSSTRARCRATGLSQVTVVFKDGTDIYFARQLVNERIQQVKDQLPPGIETAMGPISTGLGEIYMFTVEAKPDARNAEGEPYSSDRSAHDPGLDHQAATAHGSRRGRGQHHRRLRKAVPCAAGPDAADGLRLSASAT